MKLAIVVGGWHWPLEFFENVAACGTGADLFVVAHRSPELSIVREEKAEVLETARGSLADLDRWLYSRATTIDGLQKTGWNYVEEPNTYGDWGFFNQWLAKNDHRKYDIILNCHDDTHLRRPDLFDQLGGDWLLLANGKYPEAPEGYVRGSFEFWKSEFLDMLGGRIDMGHVRLTREGKVDSPKDLRALSAWNKTNVPLRDFMVRRGLDARIRYLSPHYRISPWIIEGERGFMHKMSGAAWSFEAGLKAYPL